MGVGSFEDGQLGAQLIGWGDKYFHVTASSTVADKCTSRLSDHQSCEGQSLCVPRFASVSEEQSLGNNRKKSANSLGVIFLQEQ